MHRLTRLIDRKLGRGKWMQGTLLMVLQKLFTPTPATGYVFGSVMTMFLAPFVILRIESPLVGALIVGVLTILSAMAFQKIHDKYWENYD
jgi:hypothetical protein